MPIYDYRCNSCNKRASLFFRSFSAVGEAGCPSCGSKDVRRIISAPAVLRSTEYKAGRIDDIVHSGEYDMLDKRMSTEWSRRVAEEIGGDAGARILEKVERVESGEFVPEMTDARYYAEYVASEQKKELSGLSSDLTSPSNGGSSESGGE